MSLVGNLADLGLGDILQIVSLSRRSGTLQLTTSVQSGEITFVQGSVVAVYCTASGQSVAEGLLEAGVLNATQLQELLGSEARGERGAAVFKSVPVDSGAVHEALETLLKRVVYPMFDWNEGTFSFVLEEQPDPWRAFSLNGTRVVLDRGLSPQFLAMEGARLRDERTKEDSLEAFLAQRAEKELRTADAADVSGAAEQLPTGDDAAGGEPPGPSSEDAGDKVIPFPGPRARRELSGAKRAPEADRAVGLTEAAASAAAPALQEAPVAAIAEPAAPPAALEPQLAETQPQPAAPPVAAVPLATAARLLVVDDDAQLAELMRAHLAPKFAEVVVATSVRDAVDRVCEDFHGLIVASDLILARSDGRGILGGIEVLEAARSVSADMPVVLFTDYVNKEAEAKASALGVTQILMKPRKAEVMAGGAASSRTALFLEELGSLLAKHCPEPALAPPPAAPSSAPTPPPAQDEPYDPREMAKELGATEGAPPSDLPPEAEAVAELGILRSMLSELADPANRDTVTLLVLRFAAEFVERAALFLATRQAFIGLGGFAVGESSEAFVARVRTVQLPIDLESIFTRVTRYRAMIRGPMLDTPANQELLDCLGGGWHQHPVVAIPLISSGRVAAVLYGDNPTGKALGATDPLEIFIQQAGLAMDRALLERRLEEIRRNK